MSESSPDTKTNEVRPRANSAPHALTARSDSESDYKSSPEHKRGSLRLTVSKIGIPLSPLAKELALKSTTESSNSKGKDSNKADKESKKTLSPALKRCPCGLSTGGQAWMLKCTTCTQSWHNCCANLKGKIPQSIIGQLDHWLCPWCFVPPYEPPKNHKSLVNKSTLSEIVTSDSLISQIEEALSGCITQKKLRTDYYNTI